eukprot:m.147902 g.147902  ORF g.147902 m.147902 type:complete len:283 (+) comp17786_c0_seq42:742-1590(+)
MLVPCSWAAVATPPLSVSAIFAVSLLTARDTAGTLTGATGPLEGEFMPCCARSVSWRGGSVTIVSKVSSLEFLPTSGFSPEGSCDRCCVCVLSLPMGAQREALDPATAVQLPIDTSAACGRQHHATSAHRSGSTCTRHRKRRGQTTGVGVGVAMPPCATFFDLAGRARVECVLQAGVQTRHIVAHAASRELVACSGRCYRFGFGSCTNQFGSPLFIHGQRGRPVRKYVRVLQYPGIRGGRCLWLRVLPRGREAVVAGQLRAPPSFYMQTVVGGHAKHGATRV